MDFGSLRDRLCLGPRIRRAVVILEKRCLFFTNVVLQIFKVRGGTAGIAPLRDCLCLAAGNFPVFVQFVF